MTQKVLGDPVLVISEVHKRFGRNEVLKGIDLTLRRHEVVCLIGASGSGKSTLLRCCNLLERVDGGGIELLGTSLADRRIDEDLVRRNIGIVFQSFNLFPHMSVLANVTLGPRRVLRRTKRDAEAAALELLDRIGLADKAKDYPDRLSGGQQQRLAIARCLAMDPSLLLLDEITSALDPELVAEVLALVGELADRGMTMLLATHEMGFARDVADKVCFLEDGVLVESGVPAQMFSRPADPRTQRFLQRVIDAGRL
jgi:polar amino acid transport system ATP-binding protein